MKLSEAMMLGSATVKMVAGDIQSCALGAAANAVGIPAHGKFTHRLDPIWARWPWLVKQMGSKAPRCPEHQQFRWDCRMCSATTGHFNNGIAGQFNWWVVEGRMTFEQLVDWVKSVEPECGECNRFECTCTPKGAVVGDLQAVSA